MKEKKRVARNWFFFALKLFPLVSFCLAVHQVGGSIDGQGLATFFDEYMVGFEFAYIYELFENVFSTIGMGFHEGVARYVSYLVLVLFIQIMYDVIVFLPDFCRSAFERWTKV